MWGMLQLSLLAGILLSAGPANPRPISAADSIVAVFAQDRGLVSDGRPKLILVAWADGHVVWSEDRIQGGAPYLAGDVPPERVSAVLDSADRDGAFGDKRLAQPCFGPDSKFTTILLRKASQELRMDSWHEWAEAGGRLFASSCALMPLPSGERRLTLLRKEPVEYLYYRVVWGELRELAASLIPATSQPTAGEVLMKAGVLAWREPDAR